MLLWGSFDLRTRVARCNVQNYYSGGPGPGVAGVVVHPDPAVVPGGVGVVSVGPGAGQGAAVAPVVVVHPGPAVVPDAGVVVPVGPGAGAAVVVSMGPGAGAAVVVSVGPGAGPGVAVVLVAPGAGPGAAVVVHDQGAAVTVGSASGVLRSKPKASTAIPESVYHWETKNTSNKTSLRDKCWHDKEVPHMGGSGGKERYQCMWC